MPRSNHSQERTRRVRFNLPPLSESTSSTTETFESSTQSTRTRETAPAASPSESAATTVSTSWLTKVKQFNSKITNMVLGTPQLDEDDESEDSSTESTTTSRSTVSRRSQRSYAQSNDTHSTDYHGGNHGDSIDSDSSQKDEPISLRITGGRLCTSVLRAEGVPKHLLSGAKMGKYRWYRINRNGEMLRIEDVNDNLFHPNLDDVGNKISCQWVPFGAGVVNKKMSISNFAQIGPILMDGQLEKRCNDMAVNENQSIQFRVFMPQISSFAQIITIRKNYIKVSPATQGINTMLKTMDTQQSFDIHLDTNMKVLFSDSYSSQFSIVDDEGNEYAQIIAKDHIQRQLIGIIIRKNLDQFPKQLSPRNKYYWQFKVQQLTEKNIALQREMNEIRHKNDSLMPIIQTLSMAHNKELDQETLDSPSKLSKIKVLTATQREAHLYTQLKDSSESTRILKHQISDLTAERELLKQNYIKVSKHLQKSLRNLDWYKTTKGKLTEIIKNLENSTSEMTEKAVEFETKNEELNDENIALKEELKIVRKQKDEAFNILQSDVSSKKASNAVDVHALQKYDKSELIEMIQDLQNDLTMEHNVAQHQLRTVDNYTKELQELRVENAKLRDQMAKQHGRGSNEYGHSTLSWEKQTESEPNGSRNHTEDDHYYHPSHAQEQQVQNTVDAPSTRSRDVHPQQNHSFQVPVRPSPLTQPLHPRKLEAVPESVRSVHAHSESGSIRSSSQQRPYGQILKNALTAAHDYGQSSQHGVQLVSGTEEQAQVYRSPARAMQRPPPPPASTRPKLSETNVADEHGYHAPKQMGFGDGNQRMHVLSKSPAVHTVSNSNSISEVYMKRGPVAMQSMSSSPSQHSVASGQSSIFMSLLKAPPATKRETNAQPTKDQDMLVHQIPVNIEQFTVQQVYNWARKHPSIGIQKIANSLRQHDIDGKKLKQLDEITLHIFGVPSKYISRTYKLIKSM